MKKYLDTVILHPEETKEEKLKLLQEEKEKSEQLTDWPKM